MGGYKIIKLLKKKIIVFRDISLPRQQNIQPFVSTTYSLIIFSIDKSKGHWFS